MRNRRRFMVGLVSLPLVGMVDMTRIQEQILHLIRDSAPALQALMLALFENPEGARVVGQRFLSLYQNEAQLDFLLSKIFQGGVVPRNECMLSAYLDIRKRLDFEKAHVVNVDGWVLSVTEARVCAVVALTKKDLL
jgi:hypothetical protein